MDGENFMENPIKMDDLGAPMIFGNTHRPAPSKGCQ